MGKHKKGVAKKKAVANTVQDSFYNLLKRVENVYGHDSKQVAAGCIDELVAAGFFAHSADRAIVGRMLDLSYYSNFEFVRSLRWRTDFYLFIHRFNPALKDKFSDDASRNRIDGCQSALLPVLTRCQKFLSHDENPREMIDTIMIILKDTSSVSHFIEALPSQMLEDKEYHETFKRLILSLGESEAKGGYFMDRDKAADTMTRIFKAFEAAGVTYENSPAAFHPNCLLLHRKHTLHALEVLKQAGAHYERHPFLYERLFRELNRKDLGLVEFTHRIDKLTGMLESSGERLKTRSQHSKARLEMDLMWGRESHDIAHGPLNKSWCTSEIEDLINRIVKTPHQGLVASIENNADKKNQEDCLLAFHTGEKVNLSLLIRNANLTHLQLSKDTVKAIGRFLKVIARPLYDYILSPQIIASQLYPEEQLAIYSYADSAYHNINKLFRGDLESIKSTLTSNHILSLFLKGCLIINAVNRVPSLIETIRERQIMIRIGRRLSCSDELPAIVRDEDRLNELLQRARTKHLISDKQYHHMNQVSCSNLMRLFPDTMLLDRGEKLDEAHIRARLANPTRYPQLTSFTCYREGVGSFCSDELTRTKLEGFPTPFEFAHRSEREVMMPPGTQIKTLRGPSGTLMARVYRSPDLEPDNQLFSDLALKHAFQNHLSEPYYDVSEEAEVGDEFVYRPNHGLAHTYRVMLMVAPVIHYFAHHASDPAFKSFCRNLGEGEREWLRVAAAFRVTGRESEVGSRQDPDLYNRYREASMNYFMAFVEKEPVYAYRVEGVDLETLKARFAHVIRYMGNPAYEAPFNDKPAINQHEDPHERMQRSFYHRILSFAHNLDLMRCYTPVQCERALQPHTEWVCSSKEQKARLRTLLEYAIKLMKAHGNMLFTDIDEKGQFFMHSIDYRAPFARVSQSINVCRLISDGVTRPPIERSYADETSTYKRAGEPTPQGPAKKKVKMSVVP